MSIEVECGEVNMVADRFVRLNRDCIHSIVLVTYISSVSGVIVLGAFYGSVGGGEVDGGYFRIDVEASDHRVLSYNDIDALKDSSPKEHMALEALMRNLWDLVEEDYGSLRLTESGRLVVAPDNDGVWMDDDFNGDLLSEVSQLWPINLVFEA